ncbi:MAG: hypothetical protein BroJett021_33860 [Chloroflexota bacterium]|jgi:hypothetical protein|nr:MAG: hypothetical protein BroJett021_33860 [Chloroflexota bacterium]
MAKFNFQDAVRQALPGLGARERQSGWEMDSIAGLMEIYPYDDWVACRFRDPDRANQVIRFGTLNRCSGKWNWHFTSPNRNDADFVIEQLERIAIAPRLEALERMKQALGEIAAHHDTLRSEAEKDGNDEQRRYHEERRNVAMFPLTIEGVSPAPARNPLSCR